MTYLMHITIPTGHARPSPRQDVSDTIVAALGAWLGHALTAGQPVALPAAHLADYSAQAITSPGGLVVTVYGQGDVALPLATFGVARRARGAPTLWRQLCALSPIEPPALPSAPWVAVVPLAPLLGDPAAAAWLGDFERCVAWAWLEMPRDG